jgi:hypothetical protein
VSKMKISSSASAFDRTEGETAVFHAVRELTLVAGTREEAEFLAKLHACIRRGQPDRALMYAVEERP